MRDPSNGIVCFSVNEWADVPRNQVQLMRVAERRGYAVLYVETIGLRRPDLTVRDIRKVWRRLRRIALPLRKAGTRFWVLSPIALPFAGYRWADRLNERLVGFQVRVATRVLKLSRPILWTYLPQATALAAPLRARRTLYFRCDEYPAMRGVNRQGVQRLERDAVARADLCVASARHYLDGPLSHARRSLWSPNAVDLGHYPRNGDGVALPGLRKPLLLMMGTLERWLAVGLLVEVLSRRTDWTLLLCGPIRTDVDGLLALPNVAYAGVVGYRYLPDYVNAADVCLIPFLINEITLGATPGKLFQYLAAGKPVVATRFTDLGDLNEFVHFADANADAFEAAVDKALKMDTAEAANSRRSAMEAHTWDSRFAEIEAALELNEC
jgi:glycosyltransferase involved in cell wall biosynthesis